MNTPIIVPLPGNDEMAASLARRIGGEMVLPVTRAFPDGETYFKLDVNLRGREVVLVCTLDRPDSKFLPLVFAAETARDLGAARVGLVAPYLSYMRQDRRFQPGEALSAKIFASELSPHFDWLVTIDPHLHRVHALGEIFTVRTRVLHAAPAVSAWIVDNVQDPVIIGPDFESAQWVAEVAKDARAPFVVLAKIRKGDQDVEVSVPESSKWRDHTPVLVDDIISTGRTMIETLGHLRHAKLKPAVCMGVHAIFAPAAYESLLAARPARIVTTNTVKHPTNGIDISAQLADAIREVEL